MTKRSVMLAGVLSMTLTACWNSQQEESVVRELRPMVSEVEIPRMLWSHIEKVYTGKKSADEGVESLSDEDPLLASKARQIPLRYTPVSVSLIEVERGMLGGRNYQLNFGEGGGVLDFADYVRSSEGGFVFQVNLPEAEEKVDRLRVFFWPNGKQRKVKETILGSSCTQVLDLTDYFRTQVMKRGMQVSATAKRYVTLLAGIYVFAIKKENTLYLSHLRVEDSRYGFMHCRELS